MLFGACLWALEGYMEKRKGRIIALPVILASWALADPSWIVGLLFIASYLSQPCPQRPVTRLPGSGLRAFPGRCPAIHLQVDAWHTQVPANAPAVCLPAHGLGLQAVIDMYRTKRGTAREP